MARVIVLACTIWSTHRIATKIGDLWEQALLSAHAELLVRVATDAVQCLVAKLHSVDCVHVTGAADIDLGTVLIYEVPVTIGL